MAYRPDDPYNIGIGTPDLGNINMGQVPVNNMYMTEIGPGQTKYLNQPITQKNLKDQSFGLSTQQVFDNMPGYEDKPWFGKNQEPTTAAEFNEYLKSIGITGESQMVKDKESGDQTYLDLDNMRGVVPGYNPYAGMTGRTAMINPLSIIGLVKAGLSKKQIAKVLIKNKLQKEIGKKVKPVLTGILTGGKAAAAAPTSHKEAQATGGDYHSDTRSTVDGQTTEWGDELFSRGGLAQYAPRGSYFNGGLASLYRHGGF